MASPYPWHYSVRWLYYYFRPSTKNHSGLGRLPLSADFGGQTRARLVFFGDLMCMRGDRVPVIDPALRSIVRGADLVIGNCETPVIFDAMRPDALYLTHFGTSAEFIGGALDALGATPDRTALSIANNHMGDQGPVGYRQTVSKLGALGVRVLGRADAPLEVMEAGGLRVGLSAWTEWMNFDRIGEAVSRSPRAFDWAAARRQVDVLVATPHWEWEFQHFPRRATRALAAELMGAGVDLVVGHHPHVLQPLERVGRGLCLYSLGNLNGPAYSRVAWPVQLGALFEVRIGAEGLTGYTIHPFAQLIAEDRSATLVPLDVAPEPLGGPLRERLALLFDLR